jgi:hypothetical protein
LKKDLNLKTSSSCKLSFLRGSNWANLALAKRPHDTRRLDPAAYFC